MLQRYEYVLDCVLTLWRKGISIREIITLTNIPEEIINGIIQEEIDYKSNVMRLFNSYMWVMLFKILII